MKQVPWNATLAVAAAALLIVGAAAIEGHWSGRFRAAPPAARAPETLALPATLGDWERLEGPERLDTVSAPARWVYRRARPAATVTLFLVAGRCRDLALHNPEACYPGSSLRLCATPQATALEAPAMEASALRAAFFREEPSGRRLLEAIWTSRIAGHWTATASGRLNAPQLKVYVFTEEPGSAPDTRVVALDFTRTLLPELEKTLKSNPEFGIRNSESR